MRIRKYVFVLAFCTLTSASCDQKKATKDPLSDAGGDPTDGALPDGGTGIDAGGILTNLSPEERQRLCTEARTLAFGELSKPEFKQSLCRFTGFFAAVASGATTSANVQSACKEEFDSCLTDKAAPLAATACTLPNSCNITATELQTCLTQWVMALQASYSAFPACATLSIEELEEASRTDGAEVATPVACEAALASCPGLF